MKVLEYEEFRVTHSMVASQGKRLANLMIDRIAFYIVVFVLFFMLSGVFEITNNQAGLYWINTISKLEDVLISAIVVLLYYTILESLTGRTLGKLITNTSVVNQKGEKPTFEVILKRTFIRLIPFDAFSFLSTPCRGWHDEWVGTFVVDNRVFLEQKELFDGFKQLGIEKD